MYGARASGGTAPSRAMFKVSGLILLLRLPEGGLQEPESVHEQQPACRMRHDSIQVAAGLIPPASRQL